MATAARKLLAALRDGPMRRKEIDALLGGGSVMTNGVGLWVDLVRVPPSGTWERRRADLYGLAEDWLEPVPVSREEGVVHLLRRYLGGFGPAALPDIANWAGLSAAAIEPALAKLRLRRFQDQDGAELVDLPRGPLPDPETPVPVRFLPIWDATLLAHARRAGILPEEYRPRVFNTRTPQSAATFLVDGQVAGTWRYEKGRVELDPFRRLDASTRKALAEEAARLAEFHRG
jgi:winged helix DNA-binding protein